MTRKINQRKIELCKQYKEIVRKTAINLENDYQSGRLTYTEYFFKLSKALKGRTPESWISYYDNLIYKLSNNEKIAHIIPPKGTRQYFNFTEHILLVVVITLILSSALLLGSSSITGSAIFDVFKQPLIDLASNSYTQDQELLFAVNPTFAGVYKEVYILNQQGVHDSIILDCASLICYDTTLVHKDISQYAPGDYEIAVFDYNKNDYVRSKFTVGVQLEGIQKNLISHDFICNKCSSHKVPPLTNVQVVLETNNPGGYATISDYFPSEWGIINASNGYVVRYNSTHNKISWDVESNETILVFSYILFAPQKTLPPTEYYFIGEINGIKDEPWQVIVADPPPPKNSVLNVSISEPIDLQVINQREYFNITSKVTCLAKDCNGVFATARFNITGAFPFRPINATNGEKPISVSNSRYAKLIQNLTYGFGSDDAARDIVLDSNNMYVIGYQNNADWLIMKINLTGKSIWNRTYTIGEHAYSAAIDSSQTYIYVAGYQYDADQNWRIMKLDINGISIWNRTYNLGITDRARQIRIDKNDDLYAVGSQGSGVSSWRIMKLDTNGASIWNFTFDPNPSYPDQANAVAIDKNNDIVVAGIDNTDWRIMKLNVNGISIWNRTFNLAATDTPYGVGIDSYNNIYVVGQIGGVTNDWGIMKLNVNGISIWNRTYDPAGGSDRAQGIFVDINDKIYVFGYHIDADADWRIMKLDINGNSIWNRSRSIGITDNIYSIASDSSNLYAVGQIGITSLDNDWRIMKIDNSLSYQYCGILAVGQSCIFDWQINGTKAGAYRAGVYYNSTTSGLFNVTENRTIIVGTTTSTTSSTSSTSTTSTTTSTSTSTVLGTLNVSISKPNDLEVVPLRRIFNITSKVTCLFNDCTNVYATPRYRVSQYARPDQDVNVNSWDVEPLFSKIDETIAVDTTGDRINSTLISVSSATNISLSAVTDPVSSTGHIIRVRYRKQGLRGTGGGCGGPEYLLGIRLFQGTTKIVNATYYNVPCTFAYANYTLTASEADSITDYSNLTLMLLGNIMDIDLPTRKLQVSWAELEVPSPSNPINATNGEIPLSVFLSKYTMSIWNRTYNPGVFDVARAITIDSSNNIYAVGHTSSVNWFIMKINSTGGSIWNRTYNPAGTDRAQGITIDSSNNIYAVGHVDGVDWFIMKINSTGGSIWNRTYNPAGTDVASSITIDSSNNIYAVGYRTDADVNWFIMKINSTGGSIWNRTYNPAGTDIARAITIDSSNNIYVVGYRTDASANWFIMKINSTGGSIWNRTYDPAGTDEASSITIDSSNNIYAVGDAGGVDWVIMKINSTGGSIWNRTYNPGAADAAQGITIDSSNNIYVVGYRADASINWFIMKIDTAGNSIWNRTYDPAGTDRAQGITIDSSNNIYAVGHAGGVDWAIMKIDNSLSYQYCGILAVGQSCIFDWQINATRIGRYGIDVYYNQSGTAAFNVTETRTVIVGAFSTTSTTSTTSSTTTSTTTTSTIPDLTLINITIKPQGIVEPFINANVTMNATVYISNNSAITGCLVRIYNSTSLVFTPSPSTLSGPIRCFAPWDMDYWRNPGTWNVTVNITTTAGSNKMIFNSFTYNSLKASVLSTSYINFTGDPGQTVQSYNAYPLTIKNAGNEKFNISLMGTDYIGQPDSSKKIIVTNSTINQTSSGIFNPITYTLQQLYNNTLPREIKEIYFKTFIPQNILSQEYEGDVTILI